MDLTPESARAFAARWFNAWNAHDIDAIMACYDAAISHSSPFIARYNASGEPSLEGIAAVRAYFTRALARNPTLRFDPEHTATGIASVILTYRRHSQGSPETAGSPGSPATPPEGDLAAEVFFLNASGKIVRSVSHYG